MTDDLRARSAADVFDEHLRLSDELRYAEDIDRNVSPSCVVLDRRGVFRGYDGVKLLARWLGEELPNARFTYTNRLVEGRVAFLEWTAEADGARVRDGADSYVIEDGWIVAQTIHYTVESTR
ncbi:nuclear transport factor 2 family protein [Micromonospora sp. NPDC047548]|uniref:nuclear transport factor 2 family protein n=1 Tax=Micromonospora sp. NPDC047548 TaxID=3155624 RepID=UPI0033F17366